MEPTPSTLCYTLDANDCIVSVTGPWDLFALANDGPGACKDHVVGKSLESFISGDSTLMFVRTMLMSARTLNRTIYRPYRCDSSEFKRFMEMRISPASNGHLTVMHRQLHTEPKHSWVAPRLRPRHEAGHGMVCCSMCNRVQSGRIWEEKDDIGQPWISGTAGNPPGVSFEICPECRERPGLVL